MITLDQVMLLEQKVESAVAKIQQLQAENDALRTKCQELTNALSSKTEQLSSIETDQNQIESGIKKALDRLLYIENAVLKSGASVNAAPVQAPSSPAPQAQIVEQKETPKEEAVEQKPVSYVQYNQPIQPSVQEAPVEPNFESMQIADNQPEEEVFEDNFDDSEESQDNLGFDIF
ncbi:MAG: cell division protein ZapB [Treponema sp.]|nr:cell division protein ZapB [Treponema sp.]